MAGISHQNSRHGWKTMQFFCPQGWQNATFSENLAGISTLTQWTPCIYISIFLFVLFL